MTTSQIIAFGGGGFSEEPYSLISDEYSLDDYVLDHARRPRPRVCFVPTASGDSDNYIVRFYAAFSTNRCEPSHLPLFRRRIKNLREYLLQQDVIYVGGGNTANLLAVWRVHELDKILPEVLESGTLLCGISAGAMCWFEGGLTDSFGPPLAPLAEGLGFLPGYFCPHLDREPQRRHEFRRLVERTKVAGIAAEDHSALHFVDRELVQVVSTRPNASAYRFDLANSEVIESRLTPHYLGQVPVS
jgi:dipeptidase E